MAKSNGSANTNQDASSSNPFAAFMPSFNIPAFDMEAMMQAQRKNTEAFTQAGQRAFQNMQAIMQRQNEMVRESWQATSAMAAEVMAVASPQEKVAKQTEVTKTAIDKAVSNSRELTEMLTKCNMETAEAFTSCMTEAMDTVRTACARK